MSKHVSLRRRAGLVLGVALAASLAVVVAPASGSPAVVGLPTLPPGIDPTSWVLPEDMTWEDYVPVPGYDWADDPQLQAPKPIRTALILADYEDQPMVMTQPNGSDLVGNPQSDGGVPREQVAQWWADFLNQPQPVNHGHTLNEYWLENS